MIQTIIKTTQTIILTIIFVALIFTAFFYYNTQVKKEDLTEIKAKINLNKNIIIKELKKLAKLEVLEVPVQSQIDIELNQTMIDSIFLKIDNKQTQSYYIEGTIRYSVDLSTLKADDIICNTQTCTLINIPAIQVEIILDSQNSRLLNSEGNFWNSLNQASKTQFQEKFRLELDSQGKTKIAQADNAKNRKLAIEQAQAMIDKLINLKTLETK